MKGTFITMARKPKTQTTTPSPAADTIVEQIVEETIAAPPVEEQIAEAVEPQPEAAPAEPAARAPTRAELREMRLREIREKAEASGNLKEMFPTSTYSVSVPSYPLMLQAPTMEAQPIQEGRLATLAHEINTRFTLADKLDGQANDHRLAAAIQLAEAKSVCEVHKINFRHWAEGHVPQAYDTVRKLAAVGSSDNPKQALEDLRNKNALANAALRERRQRAIAAPDPFAPAGETEPAAPAKAPRQAPPAPSPAPPVTTTPVEILESDLRAEPPADEVQADPVIQARVDAAYEAMTPEAKAALWKANDEEGRERSNYFATVESLLTDFETLGAGDKAEFLRLAAESVGIVIELPV